MSTSNGRGPGARTLGVMIAATGLALGGCGERPVPTPRPAAAPGPSASAAGPDRCALASVLARVTELRVAGKLDRATRWLGKMASECPALAPGLAASVRQTVAELEAAGGASPDELVRRAREARVAGRLAEAQRSFDRARASLLRTTGYAAQVVRLERGNVPYSPQWWPTVANRWAPDDSLRVEPTVVTPDRDRSWVLVRGAARQLLSADVAWLVSARLLALGVGEDLTLRSLGGPSTTLRSVSALPALSAHGRTVAVAHRDGRIALFDAATLAPLGAIAGAELAALPARRLTFIDGDRLLLAEQLDDGDRGPFVVYDLATGQATVTHPDTAVVLQPSPTGRLLATLVSSGSDAPWRVAVLEARTGREVARMRLPVPMIALPVFAFSPDERQLVGAFLLDALYVLDVGSGASRLIQAPRQAADDEGVTGVGSLVVSADGMVCGRWTASFKYGTCQPELAFDLRRGRAVRGPEAAGVGCYGDGQRAIVYRVPASAGRAPLTSGYAGPIGICNQALAGRTVAYVDEQVGAPSDRFVAPRLNLLDLGTGQVRASIPLPDKSTAFAGLDMTASPDGSLLVMHFVDLWMLVDVANGSVIAQGAADPDAGLQWSPGGRFLLEGHEELLPFAAADGTLVPAPPTLPSQLGTLLGEDEAVFRDGGTADERYVAWVPASGERHAASAAAVAKRLQARHAVQASEPSRGLRFDGRKLERRQGKQWSVAFALPGPEGIVAASFVDDGRALVTARKDPARLEWYDPQNGAVTRTQPLGPCEARWLGYQSDPPVLWALGGAVLCALDPATGARRALLEPVTADAAVAWLDGGVAELIGPVPAPVQEQLGCRFGDTVTAVDVCAERNLVSGAYAKAVAGDRSYLDP